MDFQQFTQPSNLPWTLMIAFVGMAMMTMVVLLIHQQRTISKLEDRLKPKYGFLGKPLYSIFGVMVLVGGFAVTYYASGNIAPVQTLADKNLEVRMQFQIGQKTEGTTPVHFSLTPIVDSSEWGTIEDEYVFDAFWTITSFVPAQDDSFKITQPEISLTRQLPGGFTKKLASGTYKIKVVLVFDDRNWTEEKTLLVP